MDRSREVKREESRHSLAKQRQSKASGHKLVSVGGNVEFLETSKKERVRGSSPFGRVGSSHEEEEMMGVGSEGVEEFQSRKSSSKRRFKINGKIADDCNAVDPAVVPRRLRSAMNKRNHESVSPPSTDGKKYNNLFMGTESANVKGTKRSKKLGGSDRSLKHVILSVITKDEEEVAEALYSLASMVDEPAKSRQDRAAKADMHFPLPETKTNSVPPSVASKEKATKSPNVLAGVQAFSPTSCKESSAETLNAEPVNGTTVSEMPASFEGENFQLEVNAAAQDVLGIVLLSTDEQMAHTQLNDAVNSITSMEISSKSYAGNGLRETMKPESLPMRRQEIVPLPAIDVTKQQEAKPIKENAESCTHIQEGAPDLQPARPKGLSDGHWRLTMTSSNKAGAWPDSTTYDTRPSSAGNYVSKEKIELVSIGRKQSLKRCASHVYLSRLIRVYQSMEKSSTCAPSVDQSKLKGVESGITTSSNQTRAKTVLSNVTSVAAHGLMTDRDLHEARIGTQQDNRLLQDQQASTSSGIYHPQNQNCDFLSLGASCESNRNPGKVLEPSAQINGPYLHPLVQYPVVPFSLQHARYTSPYPEQVAAAAAASQQVRLQSSQYSGKPFCGQQLLGHGSAVQQQQQQQLCASQMAHHRLLYPSSPHVPKWQNGRYEAPTLIPCSLGSWAPSPSSLEVLGPKNTPNPQQQQLFPILSSSPSSRGKRLHHNHPSSFDEGRAVFRPDGVPHLQQLLCNAQNM
ncbi:hypothetical protein AAC387_Pa05g3672 [Persea americana]